MQKHIDDALRVFSSLKGLSLFSEADEAAYQVAFLAETSTPVEVFQYLKKRTDTEDWPSVAPVAGLTMGMLFSKITDDAKSQGASAQLLMTLMQNPSNSVCGRANFHIAELMLNDPQPSVLLRTRIENCLITAIDLGVQNAALLLGTVYSMGTLATDGKPQSEKAAVLFVKAIEEFNITSAKMLLLRLMQEHDIKVEGYDISELRRETRIQ